MNGNIALIGFVETCASGPGYIVVSGWAATAEKERLRRLLLTIEGVGEASITRFHFRPDLAAAGIAGGYAGFERVILTGREAPETPAIHAITPGGAVPLVGPGTRFVSFEPRGALDLADEQDLSGWLVDPGLVAEGAGAARLRIDGRHELPVRLNLRRDDLAIDFGGDEPLFGFRVATAALRDWRLAHPADPTEIELMAGARVVARARLPALDGGAAPPAAIQPKTAAVGELTVVVEERVQSGAHLFVSGWVAGADASAAAPPLTFSVEGAAPVAVLSLDDRPDLAQAGIAGGQGGFRALFQCEPGAGTPQTLRVAGDGCVGMAALDSAQRSPGFPKATLTVQAGVGVFGEVVGFPDEGPGAGFELRIGDVCFPVELKGAKDANRVWSAAGVAPTEYCVGAASILNALRAAGAAAFPPEHIFTATLHRRGAAVVSGAGALLSPHQGRLERVSNRSISGWLAGHPEIPAEADVYLNGIRYATVCADRPRADLIEKNIVTRGGGFQLDIANPSPCDEHLVVSVHPAFQTGGVLGSDQATSPPPAGPYVHSAYAVSLAEKSRGVSIVIPIHNAADDLEICLKSLCDWTTFPCRAILIDDASTDPRIGEILRRHEGIAGIEIHRNAVNLGFTRTVNRGVALAGEDDVVLLNSDTALTPLWLQGLRAAAYSSPRVATATPLSNNAGVFSAPEMNGANHIPAELGVEGMARLVQHCALSAYPRVPTGNGYCLYIRRACLDEIGALDEQAFPVGYGEENDFCMRALHAGFEHVMDDRTYVYHRRSASFGASRFAHYEAGMAALKARYPEYSRLTAVFAESAEILGVRWRLRRALQAAERPLPRVLFVISTETGGTPQTNRDLMRALRDHFEPWLLRCDGREIKLWRVEAGGDVEIEAIRLKVPLEPLIHRSEEYDVALFDILTRHAFELVHIRHLGWHGLGIQAVCERIGVPWILSLHDFYTICPSVKLLDENNTHCGGACTTTPGECAVELWDRASFPPLKNQFVAKWQATFGRLLGRADALVTTSPQARDIFLRRYPALADRDFRVIPHGRDFSDMGLYAAPLQAAGPLRILVPGNISTAKGAGLIAAIVAQDQGRTVEFHVLGDFGRLKAQPGLALHGRYDREEFSQKARAIQAHVGAVFSIWPETYCHTLTEMWAFGLPAIGVDIGAVGERIAAHGGGWLIAPEAAASADAVLALARDILADPGALAGKIAEVARWQQGSGRQYSTHAMASRYRQLYADVFDRARRLRPVENVRGRAKKIVEARQASLVEG